MKPHKHAEIIKAWADGAEIERRYSTRNLNYSNWESVFNPDWDVDKSEYRIKPQPKEPQYLYVYSELKTGYSLFTENKETKLANNVNYIYIGKIKLETEDE